MTDNDLQDALNQYAQDAESRKRDVIARLGQALPEVVQSIESTSVAITMRPKMVPLAQIDAESFLGLVQEKFNLKIDPPKALSHIKEIGDASDWTDEKILRFALRQEDVDFSGGLVSAGQNIFVPIPMASVTREKIIVFAEGHTEVAEYVAAEIFEAMWVAAGAPKRWGSAEVQGNISLKSYGTITKVSLGHDLLSLLAEPFVAFLDKNLRDGMAAEMTAKSSHDNFEAPTDVVSTFGVDELDFRVNVFNTRTGRAEESMIKMSVTARDDMGRGVFDFFTELPTERHFELIKNLASVIQKRGT